MKFVLVLSAVIFVALAAPQKKINPRLKEAHEKCQLEAPLPEDYFEKNNHQEKPESKPENFGKHILCMNKEFGSITAEGKINKEKLKENLEHMPGSNAAKVTAAVDECAKDYESDVETAVKLQECIHHQFGRSEHGDHHHH